MLALVIPQTNTSFLFVFNLRLVFLVLLVLFSKVSEGLKKSNTFWLASALVETEAVQDSDSCTLPKLENVLPLFINKRKWAGSLFILRLQDNFTRVKVKEVCFTEWTLHLTKFCPSHSKMLM